MKNKIYRPDYLTTTDARVLRTREALRDALLALLDDESFEQVTIREIASRAGIGYTTFFRHHPTKESLLQDLAAEEVRQLLEFVLSSFDTEDTRGASLGLFGYVDAHRSLWSTLLTGGAASTLREEFIRIARLVAADTPQASDWLPADVGVVLVASGTIELLSWWLGQEQPAPVAAVATIYERAILSPIYRDFDD